jgi:hypothetical protein
VDGAEAAIAALAFVEGVGQLGTPESLRAWLESEVRPNGWADELDVVREPDHEPIRLGREVDRDALRALLRDARANVVTALRGLVWRPVEDTWIADAVGRGHVLESGGRRAVRVPAGRSLSELVLALLAADALTRRRLYDERLCVCSVCSRVSFEPSSGRLGCPSHPVRPTPSPPPPSSSRRAEAGPTPIRTEVRPSSRRGP